MNVERTDKADKHTSNLDRYLLMNEKEKDAEIEKAVIRLQKRIQEILYLIGTEQKTDEHPR